MRFTWGAVFLVARPRLFLVGYALVDNPLSCTRRGDISEARIKRYTLADSA